MKDYDVVVIGAGLGGLSSAANLAKAGKKVLLLERHYVPGGYASSFLQGALRVRDLPARALGPGGRGEPGAAVEAARRGGRHPQGGFPAHPRVLPLRAARRGFRGAHRAREFRERHGRVFPGRRRRHQGLYRCHVQVRAGGAARQPRGHEDGHGAPGRISHPAHLFRQEPAGGHGPVHQGREGAHRAQRGLRLLLQPPLRALVHDLCPGDGELSPLRTLAHQGQEPGPLPGLRRFHRGHGRRCLAEQRGVSASSSRRARCRGVVAQDGTEILCPARGEQRQPLSPPASSSSGARTRPTGT